MTREVISRDAFLKPIPVEKEDVPVPEFGNGACVPVWGLTARERAVFEKQFQNKNGKSVDARTQQVRERLLVACCRNDDGTPMFTVDDIRLLGDQSVVVVERIVEVALRLAGMKNDDVEALAKNSGETQSD